MTARGCGGGITTFRGPQRLSYNSRNFLLTWWFPSPFNIWSARPISSCFLPVFDRPAKPSNDWSSETRKLINMCCGTEKDLAFKIYEEMLWFTAKKSKFYVFFSPEVPPFPPCWNYFFEKQCDKPRPMPHAEVRQGYDVTKHGVKSSHNLVPRALSLNCVRQSGKSKS